MSKTEVDMQMPDVKKVLGCPKITFIIGGPASGKRTQCAKLVEEFGYTYIKTGDLFRAEVAKGSREGEMMKRIMNEQGLIPYQLTVQVLVNALIANPAKNYLIDGFPRAKDQAIYFEQVVGEVQTILYFNTAAEVCCDREMSRQGQELARDVVMGKIGLYEENAKPVLEMYQKFGKVREIDGAGDTFQVWGQTRRAMLPQVQFLIGPKVSGKKTLGNAISERTNSKLLKFNEFVKENDFEDTDDDTVVLALIQQLAKEICPRVIISDFPQTAYQAKFFIKNGCFPSRVFVLNCSKDFSQERMILVPETSPRYLPSALLSKRIGKYNENLQELLPFLKDSTELSQISTEVPFQTSFKQMCSLNEPTIISVRSSGSKDASQTKHNVMTSLVDQGYIALEVNDLIQLEVQRQTDVGRQIQELLNSGKNVWAEPKFIVSMLRRIIYSGLEEHDKFLLVAFPDQIDHAQLFEQDCATISAIVYTTAKDQPTVEVKGDDLSNLNLDSLFAKQFRLKIMNEWDSSTFAEHLGKKINFGVVIGKSLSGKKTVAAQLSKIINGKVINMANIAEELKKNMGTEEEPFEGEVPVEKVEEAILEIVSNDRTADRKFTYIFADWVHKSAMDFLNAMNQEFGLPTFAIECDCDIKVTHDRFKKKNDIEGDMPEEAVAELAEATTKSETTINDIAYFFEQMSIKHKLLKVNTDGALETTINSLRSLFSAKILVVNHENRLEVDTNCSNLAIKYNLFYLSVQQCIKEQIKSDTDFGKKLVASRRQKALLANSDEQNADQNDQSLYNPVHYDARLVLKLIQTTLAEKRTNQSYILLEGLFNCNKLEEEQDKLSCRFMDELFMIEKSIGEVAGIISLSYHLESQVFEDRIWEEFEAPKEKEVPEKVFDDDGNEVPPAEAEALADDGEVKAPVFNPAEFKWTVTNKRAKNLPQIFSELKGQSCVCSEMASETISPVKEEAITKSLDQFCTQVIDNAGKNHFYHQVIFVE